MPKYRYKAIDAKGNIKNGETDAESLADLTGKLDAEGFFLMEGKSLAAEPAPSAPGVSAAADSSSGEHVATSRDTVDMKSVSIFTSQWAVMVRTSLPILEALDMLAHQSDDPVFKAILIDIWGSVRQGQPLSRAFSRYPKVFDEVYVSLLASGEASGKLDVMLDRLASYLEFQLAMKDKIRSSLVYPTIVVATAVAVVGFLVIFVLPTFMEVFTQFDIALPLPTQILIFVSEQVRRLWYLFLLGLGGIWWYFSSWLMDPSHTRLINDIQLRLPVIGPLTRNIVMTRMLRTLGSLTDSGIPILKSLELAKAASGNLVFGDIMDEVISDVREGKGIAGALGRSPFVPSTVAGMIATGEKTGTLPEVLGKVSAYYEAELDTSIKNLFSALEPAFIVCLGLLVGGIAFSVLLPMFNLAGGLQ